MKHLVSADPLPEDASKMRVRLDLEEFPQAPALGEAFSPAEQAALRCREWLIDPRKEEDLWLSFPLRGLDLGSELRLLIVCGYGRGVLVRYQTRQIDPAGPAAIGKAAAPETQPGTRPVAAADFDMAFCAAHHRSGFWDLQGGQKFVGGDIRKPLDAFLSYVPNLDRGTNRPWSFNVGANISDKAQKGPDGPLPVEMKMTLAPVAFLHLVHEDGLSFELKDGIVTGSNAGGTRIRVEAATGRLLEYRLVDASGTSELRVERGALARELAALEGAVPADANRFDPQAPLASGARFAADELARLAIARVGGPASSRAGAGAAVRKLLTPAVLRPLDEAEDALKAKSDSGFRIPADPAKLERAKAAGPLRDVALFMLAHYNNLFPRGSWPWTLLRQSVLAVAGADRGARGEWERLLASDEVGPVGCLLAAEALRGSDPQMASAFAQRGLARLDADYAARDWKALLTADGVLPRMLLGAAENLRTLSRVEVDALADAADAAIPSSGEAVRAVANDLRASRDKPIAQALPDTLDRLWVISIQDRVGKALRAIAADAGAAK
jgi:hypothetical protein